MAASAASMTIRPQGLRQQRLYGRWPDLVGRPAKLICQRRFRPSRSWAATHSPATTAALTDTSPQSTVAATIPANFWFGGVTRGR
jgi:hypothetical protein